MCSRIGADGSVSARSRIDQKKNTTHRHVRETRCEHGLIRPLRIRRAQSPRSRAAGDEGALGRTLVRAVRWCTLRSAAYPRYCTLIRILLYHYSDESAVDSTSPLHEESFIWRQENKQSARYGRSSLQTPLIPGVRFGTARCGRSWLLDLLPVVTQLTQATPTAFDAD